MATKAWQYRLVLLNSVIGVGWRLHLEDGTTVHTVEAVLNAFGAADWELIDRREVTTGPGPQEGAVPALQLVFKRPVPAPRLVSKRFSRQRLALAA